MATAAIHAAGAVALAQERGKRKICFMEQIFCYAIIFMDDVC